MNMNNNGMSKDQKYGQKDFVDKAVESVERKFGGSNGNKLADQRGVNEKATDKLRGMFESSTGKKVPHNISN